MATAPQEMEDLAKVPGALLVNFGTIANKDGMLAAGNSYRRSIALGFDGFIGHYANLHRKPIVFDPVGVGATAFRRSTASGNEKRIIHRSLG
jgi:thiamine-phosphate diphosphorylase / hydroxyethylthiazole kinase